MKIAVIFSTLSGNTSLVANNLVEYLNESDHEVELLDAISTDPNHLKEYELIFFGSSTYGDGDLNPITELFFSMADQEEHNCNNTHFAFFSLGDSSYPNFSTSGKLSQEKITSMQGKVLEPIFHIDGYPDEKIFKETQAWAKGILKQYE